MVFMKDSNIVDLKFIRWNFTVIRGFNYIRLSSWNFGWIFSWLLWGLKYGKLDVKIVENWKFIFVGFPKYLNITALMYIVLDF